jgi:hypothetical protein
VPLFLFVSAEFDFDPDPIRRFEEVLRRFEEGLRFSTLTRLIRASMEASIKIVCMIERLNVLRLNV